MILKAPTSRTYTRLTGANNWGYQTNNTTSSVFPWSYDDFNTKFQWSTDCPRIPIGAVEGNQIRFSDFSTQKYISKIFKVNANGTYTVSWYNSGTLKTRMCISVEHK